MGAALVQRTNSADMRIEAMRENWAIVEVGLSLTTEQLVVSGQEMNDAERGMLTNLYMPFTILLYRYIQCCILCSAANEMHNDDFLVVDMRNREEKLTDSTHQRSNVKCKF